MKKLDNIKKFTPYQDINETLAFLVNGIMRIFGEKAIGIYLTGSLSYGDFDLGRSDIDLAVIIRNSAHNAETDEIKALHEETERKFAKWLKRIECSYIPLKMIENILPPKEPRPYFGGGVFYAKADYGNEWIINQYFLYKNGVALIGPDFKTLVRPIKIEDVREACVRDLYKEWEPKLHDDDYLRDSHQQSYVVLNLCRILYTVSKKDAVSKPIASEWAKRKFPEWASLIGEASNWRYGIEMRRQEEVKQFIKFAIKETERQAKVLQH